MARAPTQKEIAAFIVGHGITDFVTGGRLSLIERNALWKVLKKLGPPAVRAGPRLGMTALRGAKFITMRHPYIAAAVVTYEVVKNREQIEQLAREGWEVVQDVGAQTGRGIQEAIEMRREDPRTQDFFGLPVMPSPGRPIPDFLIKPKRRKSKYNTAMAAALKAVKSSTKGGKKGTISPVKSVFKTVSKVVSKVNKGAKVSPLGISGIAAKAARRILGKKKKTTKKTKKRGATYTYRK